MSLIVQACQENKHFFAFPIHKDSTAPRKINDFQSINYATQVESFELTPGKEK